MKINESTLRYMIKESIKKRLLKEYDDDDDMEPQIDIESIKAQCEEYYNILINEFKQAEIDVRRSNATFHNGLMASMTDKGYTVVSYRDNSICFIGPSKLFKYSAFQDHSDGVSWNAPWILSKKIEVEFENYSYNEPYYYPYTRSTNVLKMNIDNFVDNYKDISFNEVYGVAKLKPFKTEMERIDEFERFIVTSNDNSQFRKEFDNFEDAKKCAYEMALEECKKGKRRDDITSRYFHSKPVDITYQHSFRYPAVYEFYEYGEHSYYYYVWALGNK